MTATAAASASATEVEARAVTFDAGQTLIELDTAMLARRLAERGVIADEAALAAARPVAWQHYEALVKQGGPTATAPGGAADGAAPARPVTGHDTPWQVFMSELLVGAGVAAAEAPALAAWLWDEQPRANLWRRAIPGMFELAAELARAGVPVAILSNSEGRLAELIEEIGWAAPFAVIVDSGRLGVAKPERRIFEHTARALGVAVAEVVHVGDSWSADIEGARAVGMRAIWFGPAAHPIGDDGVAIATDAAGVRAALARWGLPRVSGDPACQERPACR